MKPTSRLSLIDASKRIGLAAAAGALLALTCASALADRGQGSIRGEARSAPTRANEGRGNEARPAEGRQAAPAARREEPAHEQPAPRRDEHAQPARNERPAPPPQRNWDDNDENASHYGGFAQRPVPARAARGARFRALPPHYRDLEFDHRHYFFDDAGAYYLLQPDNEYLVVQPPVGVIVPALPPDAVAIPVGPTTYYYLDGVFYVAQGDAFTVVNPPPGIVVPTLPDGAVQLVVNGAIIYQFNGYNYQPELQDGVTEYVVSPQ